MKRLLVIGCGDVARRALPAWQSRYRVRALLRTSDTWRAVSDVLPVWGDLDRPETLAQLSGMADLVVHLAPPADNGLCDQRTHNLLAVLGAGAILPQRLVYVSTSGVYGDCAGVRVDESRAVNPQTKRAHRRVDAEAAVTRWGQAHAVEILILRVPGIYAADRLPRDRLRRGTPVLCTEQDVYTSHIHAEDLAAVITAALEGGRPGIYNACDDSEILMGDWFDLVADRAGLPRPPRVTREQARRLVPPGQYSFMSESRRLDNRRMKEALAVRLRYRTVYEGVPGCQPVSGREVR